MNIQKLNFEGNYIKTVSEKTQIILHHTVGKGKAKDVSRYWVGMKNEKGNKQYIGTSFIIETDGQIVQLFDTEYGAGHVGDCKKSFEKFNLPIRNCSLNSIGIELISLGGLTMVDNNLIDSYGKKFKGVYTKLTNPYRNYTYFESYNSNQIESLKELLIFLSGKHLIPIKYNDDIWNITPRALSNEPGIYSHTSFRLDKSDLFPQPELISMLKTL